MVKFKNLIELLSTNKVEFVIVGGLAAVVHGASYITNDLDICYRRDDENLKRLVTALKGAKPRLRGPNQEEIPFLFDEKTLKNGFNFTLVTDLGDIDLLGELTPVGTYEQLLKNSMKATLYDHPCYVISLEDLIQTKKQAGRNKDLLLLPELEALQEIKEKRGSEKL